MGKILSRRGALVVAVSFVAGFASPARACLVNERYEPDKPFDETYFDEVGIIFRGRPVDYFRPNPKGRTIFEDPTEITFEVVTTFRGEERSRWTAFWITTAFPRSLDLEAFKREIGEDLIVGLLEPNDYSTRFTTLPLVAHHTCEQPAMRSYVVMEPVLRERGLIN